MTESEKQEIKATIVGSGKWSESFAAMLRRLVDSFDEWVGVRELSALITPLTFNPMTFLSVNAMFRTRGLPFEVVAEQIDAREKEWWDLSVKLVSLPAEAPK